MGVGSNRRKPLKKAQIPLPRVGVVHKVAGSGWNFFAPLIIAFFFGALLWAFPDARPVVKAVLLAFTAGGVSWAFLSCPYIKSRNLRSVLAIGFFLITVPLASWKLLSLRLPGPLPRPTVSQLYVADWRSCRGFSVAGYFPATYSKGPHPNTVWQQIVDFSVCYNTATDTKYLVFYVSPSPNARSVMNTMARDSFQIIAASNKAFRARYSETGTASEPLDSAYAKTADVTYIYHEDALGISTENAALKAFLGIGVKAELRGPDYAEVMYSEMKDGEATPLPTFPQLPVVDCSGRHFASIHLATNTTVGLVCRKPIAVIVPNSSHK